MTTCQGCEKLRRRIVRLREALQGIAYPDSFWEADIASFNAEKALEEDNAEQRGEG